MFFLCSSSYWHISKDTWSRSQLSNDGWVSVFKFDVKRTTPWLGFLGSKILYYWSTELVRLKVILCPFLVPFLCSMFLPWVCTMCVMGLKPWYGPVVGCVRSGDRFVNVSYSWLNRNICTYNNWDNHFYILGSTRRLSVCLSISGIQRNISRSVLQIPVSYPILV